MFKFQTKMAEEGNLDQLCLITGLFFNAQGGGGGLLGQGLIQEFVWGPFFSRGGLAPTDFTGPEVGLSPHSPP